MSINYSIDNFEDDFSLDDAVYTNLFELYQWVNHSNLSIEDRASKLKEYFEAEILNAIIEEFPDLCQISFYKKSNHSERFDYIYKLSFESETFYLEFVYFKTKPFSAYVNLKKDVFIFSYEFYNNKYRYNKFKNKEAKTQAKKYPLNALIKLLENFIS